MATALEPMSQPGPAGLRANRTAFATLIVLLALLFWLNRAEIAQLAHLWWTNGSYGHGLLVLPVSLYLVWERRSVLAGQTPAPSPVAALPAAGIALLWLLADIVDVMVVKQTCLVLMMMAIVWVMLGRRVLALLAFPLAYLLTAVPIWAVLIPVLRDVTAVVSAWIVRSMSVPVFVQGNFIEIPNGVFEIADVCAGLRFFLAGLSLAALYAFMSFRSWRRGAVFVAAALSWVIVFNWIRVVVVILIGHHMGMDHPLVEDHYSVGWVLFAVSMLPLLWLGGRMQTGSAGAPRLSTGPSVAPTGARLIGCAALCAAVIVLAPAAVRALEVSAASRAAAAESPALGLPARAGAWSRIADDNSLGSSFHNPDAVASAAYEGPGGIVYVHVAYYAYQRQGAEVINDLSRPFGRSQWRRKATAGEPAPEGVGGLVVTRGFDSRLMWHWFEVAGRRTSSRLLGKLLQAVGVLSHQPQALAVVLSTPVEEDVREASQVLGAFLEDVGDEALTVKRLSTMTGDS